ncbi:hypothetical protein RHS01_10781 [Rhizoctonia solani]|uniref:Uncharacterized protein n=1 Tax=Rhizoctonia solani TaxID=456999 RepID=A0A8H7I6B0_9AGAM|nr:hypothetical protein RHS01_10781 [Rhizoctonia solani]
MGWSRSLDPLLHLVATVLRFFLHSRDLAIVNTPHLFLLVAITPTQHFSLVSLVAILYFYSHDPPTLFPDFRLPDVEVEPPGSYLCLFWKGSLWATARTGCHGSFAMGPRSDSQSEMGFKSRS